MHATRGPRAPVLLTCRHVFINTGDVVQNATDLLSAKEAMPLFKDQEAKLQAGLAELNETLGPRLGQASALCSLAQPRSCHRCTCTCACVLTRSSSSRAGCLLADATSLHTCMHAQHGCGAAATTTVPRARAG